MRSGVFSYRLLIFEKDGQGRYRSPAELPRQALVSVATHDLPTLDGFWLGCDQEVKSRLGRYPDAAAEQRDRDERRRDRQRLLEALATEGLLPAGVTPGEPVPEPRLADLAAAVHAYLARSPAALLLANLEDLLGERDMQNLPGTIDEHPNWRRKCGVPLEAWAGHPRLAAVVAALRAEGRGRR